ncbi:hypothetical protein [Chryseobacterium sp. SIMBA_029]|uniref:hypothetical protein n=1 Tax=Chryseobacterium sp. SIMBA_029 TaxID=3085772 RepID=UPI00397DA945
MHRQLKLPIPGTYFNGSIWKSAGGSIDTNTNIYTDNGTLLTNRTVDQGGKTLAFTGATTANAFSVDGTTLSVDAAGDKVGIGSTTPDATLDVEGKASTITSADGIIAPRITKQELAAKTAGTYAFYQTGALVYVSDITAPTGAIPSSGQVAEVTTIGYYFFNGSIWKSISGASATIDTSIYAGNGILSGNRIVDQSGKTLAFNGGTTVNSFSVDGTTLSIDAANHRVGIGTAAPQKQLHIVNATAGSPDMRFENLPNLPANTSSTGLVIDTNGDVYRNNTTSVEGQILRIGLNGTTYTTLAGQAALRFNTNDDATEMGNAPNAAPNFINTIVGATISDGVSPGAGTNGSFARTTDQINLPPGVYKVQVRLVGSFTSASANNNIFIKAIVNNNEYSIINGSNNSSQASVYYFDDYINITGATSQTLDFSIQPGNSSFTVSSSASPGTGNSYRSLILIQRLR